MSKYEGSEEWQDIVPIPQDEGGPNPLAAIAYTDEYAEAMSYLRAVMAVDELSERVLALTEHVISMNPAHYTVWSVEQRDFQPCHWIANIRVQALPNQGSESLEPGSA